MATHPIEVFEQQPALAEARAGAYGFFSSFFLQEFSPELCARLLQPQVRDTLPELFGQSTEVATILSEAEKAMADSEYMRQLTLDFHSLFLVPGSAYLTPYESCYRERNQDGKAGNNWGETTRQVKALYSRFGLKGYGALKLLPDHAGIELGFMQFLADHERRVRESADTKQAHNVKQWQHHFFFEHLICWLPELTQKMKDNASTGFYRAFAELTEQFLNSERVLLATRLETP